MIRQRLIIVVAVLAAVAAGAVGTFRVASAAPVDKYVFAPTPIATAGSLPPSATVSVTVTASAAGVPQGGAAIFLSFSHVGLAPPGAMGGTASVSGTPLTITPTSFTANGSGVVTILYTAPATLPVSGRDVITAQDNATTPSFTPKTDSYAFSAVASYGWNPAPPIAATGSLAAGDAVTFQVIAKDSTGTPVPGGIVFLSITGNGSAKATDQNSMVVKTLSSTPRTFFADSSGAVPITYTTPTPLPSGGTDTITAQDRGGSSPSFTSTDTYTFGVPTPFRPQGVGQPAVALAPDGTQIIFWQGTGNHLIESWWNGHWNGPVDWTAANGWPASVTSAPTVALAPDGTQIIFWQGAGGHLDEVWWNGHWNGPVDWTAANGWPASVSSAPNVTFDNSGTQIIFWKSPAGHLDEVWWNGKWNGPVDWTAANGWGSPLTSSPSVAIDPSSGTQIIFWQGAGGHLIEVWWNGKWNGAVDWTAANGWGAPLTSAPSAAIQSNATQLIFWQGAGGHLDEVWWNGHWNGPVDWSA